MEGDNNMVGKLYLVPTPIGNLKDMTIRGVEVLTSVDIVAAEDTRQTLKLLNHFNLKKTLVSYHQHNEQGKSESIIDQLRDGKSVAIVTDAGTPGISDPGAVVVKKCIEEGIEFEVLPGATAITTALVYSGLDTTKFLFRGFLSRETKERKAVMDEIKDSKETLIFYESPHRLLSTFSFLQENLGDRNISVCRELTKIHEEIKRGKISEMIDYFSQINIKGEFVLVVEGKRQEDIDKENEDKWANISIKDHIIMLVDQGITKKEAIKIVSKERNISKKEVYKESFDI